MSRPNQTRGNTPRECKAVFGVPNADGEQLHFTIGDRLDPRYKDSPSITRITVSEDMPGPHCFLERVRVYVGESVIFEGPLMNLEGVTYDV